MSNLPNERVYEVRQDVDRFQYLLFDGTEEQLSEWADRLDGFPDGTTRRDRWIPPPVYSPNPTLERPDAWGMLFLSGCFALNEKACTALAPVLWSAELLPLPLRNETLFVVNVLEVVDCLDRERSSFKRSGAVDVYAFIAHRVPEAPLFKTPMSIRLLTPERLGAEREFRTSVERGGVRGFAFDEVWNDRDGGMAPRKVF
jgi:hypothetical protein